MKLPFTTEQFLQLLRSYNQSVFPLQVLFYVLAGIVIFLCINNRNYSNRIINSVLAFFWIWMGVVYHLVFFTTINKAAYFFGAAFILQGILFVYYGIIKDRLCYKATLNGQGALGWLFILFALVIYPLLGLKFGHVYPASPTFGLPCPTTIFSFGVLLWNEKKTPLAILFIPLVWALIGFTATIKLGITEDISLLISGIIITLAAVFKKSKIS